MILVPSFASAQDTIIDGSVRAGVEHDNNALRNEDEATPDFLARYFTNVTLTTRAMPRAYITVDLNHGGKFFYEVADADTLLTQVYLGYRQQFVDVFGIYMSVDVKDRTERISDRDYNRGAIGGGIDLTFGDFSARAGASVRYFAFKPSAESSSSSFEGTSRLNYNFTDDFVAGVGYTLARRGFDTPRFELDGDQVVPDQENDRRDLLHLASASIGYRGPVVVDFLYYYILNDSNSYGQNFNRHAFELTITAPLFWEILLTAHAEVQRTTFDDPVILDAITFIDEDNRNSLVASVARPLFDESWEFEIRYSLFLDEFGADSEYQRQTVMTAIGYLF